MPRAKINKPYLHECIWRLEIWSWSLWNSHPPKVPLSFLFNIQTSWHYSVWNVVLRTNLVHDSIWVWCSTVKCYDTMKYRLGQMLSFHHVKTDLFPVLGALFCARCWPNLGVRLDCLFRGAVGCMTDPLATIVQQNAGACWLGILENQLWVVGFC